MKITIIGASGNIGQAISLLLKINLSSCFKIYLYDISNDIKGIAKDLSHIPTLVKIKGTNNLKKALKKTKIILLCAGYARKPGMKRSDLLKLNSKIIIDIIKNIAKYSSNAWIGIITNPINIITVIVSEILKKEKSYDKNKVFGITTLDLLRTHFFVSKFKNKKIKTIIPVIGGHSESTILPLFSQVPSLNLNLQEILFLNEKIQKAGTKVLKEKNGKGSASLSMAYAAMQFLFSLINAIKGKKNIIEYAYIAGNSVFPVYFSQPFLLGINGIEKYYKIDLLNNLEKKKLKNIKIIIEKEIEIGKMFVQKYYHI